MSEKLEALLQAVIDAETDTSYCDASERLDEPHTALRAVAVAVAVAVAADIAGVISLWWMT